MLSVKNNVVNEIIINKSKFITFLFRVDSLDDVNKCIDDLRNKYSDATHICYAYVLDSVKRFNDDGEPQGTAGMPILNAIENNDLNHVLCCVVRYFGGVKLGANGLVRAYSSCCSDALKSSEIVSLSFGKVCSILFSYDNTKVVNSLLNDLDVINKQYNDNVYYEFKIDLDLISYFSNELSKYGDFKILNDCYIEKNIL